MEAGIAKTDLPGSVNQEQIQVTLESLSELTGFPVSFIRRELLLDKDNDKIKMDHLRKKVATYLDAAIVDSRN